MLYNIINLVVSSLMIVFLHDIKSSTFVSYSTIIYMVSKEFDVNRWVMKSIEISNHKVRKKKGRQEED